MGERLSSSSGYVAGIVGAGWWRGERRQRKSCSDIVEASGVRLEWERESLAWSLSLKSLISQ